MDRMHRRIGIFTRTVALVGVALVGVAHGPAFAAPVSQLPAIAANDNTTPGGRLHGGTLRLDLVARDGMWYPDGPGTRGLPIEAFGEAGKPLQIPGPLVRVPLGTRVVATIRNELGHPLMVRGLAAPGDAGTSLLRIGGGQVTRVAFVLDRPGAFGYYGSDDRGANGNNPSQTIETRIYRDAELSGAIVVEHPHAPRVDHVFVLGLYDAVKMADGTPNFLDLLETINGRSFPATERLTYERGTTVRWAVYNASSMVHPMHLHGFYFRLDRPIPYDEVTHAFRPGEAHELAWTADRAGSWMFHCHISDHITRHAPIAAMLAHRAAAQKITRQAVADRFHLADQPMGGMVIALRVVPRPGDRAPAAATPSRVMSLTFEAHDDPKAPYPGLTRDAVHLRDGAQSTESTGNLGPAIVLTRGEPVAIAVTNHTREETSVHWHGVALGDSLYDGGAGMGMSMNAGDRMAPPIEPGATFVARFAPPDAGTFMYHAHMDDGWQMASGLNGPLIVMPPGVAFDTATDHVIMIGESFERAGSPFVAIGGSSTPAPIVMTAGVAQRLRLAVLTLSGDDLVVSVADGPAAARWTPIAKDGRDLPLALQREGPATTAMTIGETRDFRFTPSHGGLFLINVYDATNGFMLVGAQPLMVSAVSQ